MVIKSVWLLIVFVWLSDTLLFVPGYFITCFLGSSVVCDLVILPGDRGGESSSLACQGGGIVGGFLGRAACLLSNGVFFQRGTLFEWGDYYYHFFE